jgi:peptidoglycan/xylan/chitin deacetylase (PgdA/CDA1 family)
MRHLLRVLRVISMAALLTVTFPIAGKACQSLDLPPAWERCVGEPLPEAPSLMPASGNPEVVDRDSDSGITSSTEPQISASAYAVNVPILMYHYVAEKWPSPTPAWPGIDNFTLTPTMLRAQIRALLAYDYTPVSLDDFIAYRLGTAEPPARPIILTFDDGMMNFYTLAAPVMREFDGGDRRVRATMFLTTNWVKDKAADRRIKWIPNGEVLIWPEVRELYAQGFSMESHATEHDPVLTAVPLAEACQRIADSKPIIQSNVPGDAVNFFAYPGGAYNDDLKRCVSTAGYSAALAAGGNIPANTLASDLWALPRYHLQNYGINQTHSVILNPAQPERFFPRIIDPSFPVPDISIEGMEFLHDDGRTGSFFFPDEEVRVRVRLTNHRATMPVRLIAALDDIDHTGCSVDVLDATRQDAGCVAWDESAQTLLAGETRSVTFPAKALTSLPAGEYQLAVDVRDHLGVLSYQRAGWQSAFHVVLSQPRRTFLPLVLR